MGKQEQPIRAGGRQTKHFVLSLLFAVQTTNFLFLLLLLLLDKGRRETLAVGPSWEWIRKWKLLEID